MRMTRQSWTALLLLVLGVFWAGWLIATHANYAPWIDQFRQSRIDQESWLESRGIDDSAEGLYQAALADPEVQKQINARLERMRMFRNNLRITVDRRFYWLGLRVHTFRSLDTAIRQGADAGAWGVFFPGVTITVALLGAGVLIFLRKPSDKAGQCHRSNIPTKSDITASEGEPAAGQGGAVELLPEIVVASEPKYQCGRCEHFARTGIIDRFKGECVKSHRRTYLNFHCRDHSAMTDGATPKQDGATLS